MSSLVMRVPTLTSRDTNALIVSIEASFKEKEMDINNQNIFLINPFQSKKILKKFQKSAVIDRVKSITKCKTF